MDLSAQVNISSGDKIVLNELSIFSKDITKEFNEYNLYLAAEKLYHYFWHTFADKILEEAKPRLNQTSNIEDKKSIQYTLLTILKTNLRLLHPFMPFITEELWTMVPKQSGENSLLLVEQWPH